MLILVGACKQNVQQKAEPQVEKILAASIEELVAHPAEYQDKEVAVQGMVTHVCRHGGQKCFVLAEDGETQIRIVPSGDIDEFKIDLEGSTVAFKGVFRMMDTQEAQARLEDHDSKEQHLTEMAHSEAEKADIYIEASDFREVTD